MDLLNASNVANDVEKSSRENEKPSRIFRDSSNPFDVYDESEFIRRFRFSKGGSWLILDKLTLTRNNDSTGSPVPPIYQLLMALRFYATGSFQIVVAEVFNVDRTTVTNCVNSVSIHIRACKKFAMQFPPSNLCTVKQGFKNITGSRLTKVLGVVGCLHVRIRSPTAKTAQQFKNGLGFYSMYCQIVSDANKKIMSVEPDWPGSKKPWHIFMLSRVRHSLELGYIPGFLIGDSNYPCMPYLLTPFASPKLPAENAYNNDVHSIIDVGRSVFTSLLRRFPCLYMGLKTTHRKTLNTIFATCILHNWALDLNEPEASFQHAIGNHYHVKCPDVEIDDDIRNFMVLPSFLRF